MRARRRRDRNAIVVWEDVEDVGDVGGERWQGDTGGIMGVAKTLFSQVRVDRTYDGADVLAEVVGRVVVTLSLHPDLPDSDGTSTTAHSTLRSRWCTPDRGE